MPRLALLCLAGTLGCHPSTSPVIRVVNADSVPLDRVMIDAGGSSYALGRLHPGTSAQIRPSPAPDSTLQIRHHLGGPFIVRAPGESHRLIEVRMFADSAGEVFTQSR